MMILIIKISNSAVTFEDIKMDKKGQFSRTADVRWKGHLSIVALRKNGVWYE